MTGRLFLLFLFLIASGHVQASICRGQLSQKSPQKAHQIKKGEDSRSFALMKAALRSISHLDALGRQHLKDRFIQNILKSGHEDLLRSYRGILINHDKELDTPLFEKFFFPRGIETPLKIHIERYFTSFESNEDVRTIVEGSYRFVWNKGSIFVEQNINQEYSKVAESIILNLNRASINCAQALVDFFERKVRSHESIFEFEERELQGRFMQYWFESRVNRVCHILGKYNMIDVDDSRVSLDTHIASSANLLRSTHGILLPTEDLATLVQFTLGYSLGKNFSETVDQKLFLFAARFHSLATQMEEDLERSSRL